MKLPKRWVVERSLAWLGRDRRHSKDYERRPESSEAWVRISAIRGMLRRLAPDNVQAESIQLGATRLAATSRVDRKPLKSGGKATHPEIGPRRSGARGPLFPVGAERRRSGDLS